MSRDDEKQINAENGTAQEERSHSIKEDRRAEREEIEEMQRRGTITPESRKQGITSHLPESETKYMYRSEDADSEKRSEKDNRTENK